jgi:hypothetical protein
MKKSLNEETPCKSFVAGFRLRSLLAVGLLWGGASLWARSCLAGLKRSTLIALGVWKGGLNRTSSSVLMGAFNRSLLIAHGVWKGRYRVAAGQDARHYPSTRSPPSRCFGPVSAICAAQTARWSHVGARALCCDLVVAGRIVHLFPLLLSVNGEEWECFWELPPCGERGFFPAESLGSPDGVHNRGSRIPWG